MLSAPIYIKWSRTGNSTQTERRFGGFQGLREGVRGVRSLFEVMKLFMNWVVVMDARPCDDTKTTELCASKGWIL